MSRPRLPSFNAHRRIAGVVTIEYALLLMLGMFPLLMLTFTGVMIFSAQQSLSLAAAEGARASLRYGDDASRRAAACNAASEAMGWLLAFSKQSSACSNPTAPPVQVTGPFVCSGSSDRQCMRVTVSYDYNTHPLLPGTGTLFGWTLGSRLQSAATAQLDLGN